MREPQTDAEFTEMVESYFWWPHWTKSGSVVFGNHSIAHRPCRVSFRVALEWLFVMGTHD